LIYFVIHIGVILSERRDNSTYLDMNRCICSLRRRVTRDREHQTIRIFFSAYRCSGYRSRMHFTTASFAVVDLTISGHAAVNTYIACMPAPIGYMEIGNSISRAFDVVLRSYAVGDV
jgi:hypothetical protein